MGTFKKGGIHPPQNKLTAGSPIVTLALPRRVELLLSQHIGAPATPIVGKGDIVVRGQEVAKSSGFVSASVHTPISGIVKKIDTVRNVAGQPVTAIIIEADEENHLADEERRTNKTRVRSDEELERLTVEEIRAIARSSGLVGLGGATFPASVKLAPPKEAKIDFLIVNGAECEPYLTCDHALMRESGDEIVKGVELMRRACDAPEAIIGIEENKPDAIEILAKASEPYAAIRIEPLKAKYPQGGEKQLVKAITGREIKSGCLPASAGTVVHNVATAYALYNAAAYGVPVIERVVTVTGKDLSRPGNFLAPIGMRLGALIDYAGGLREDSGKVILGGPMMGRAAINLDAPMVKGISGVLVMAEDDSHRRKEEPCIRCAKCVDVCPMGLEPYLISTYGRLRLVDEAQQNGARDCIECGCCSYICPASRPLLDYIRLGKKLIADKIQREKINK
ncbi:MAG: electron transport complex subunit RsxC [Paramuribaculum sp.]|nr:electron transport complex subunit RsxC [Paramuribaculum sp.]